MRQGNDPSWPMNNSHENKGEGSAFRVTGVTYRKPDGSTATIRANWTIDASGQSAVLGRSLDLRQWDPYFRNMAVYAYFRGSQRLPDPDAATTSSSSPTSTAGPGTSRSPTTPPASA